MEYAVWKACARLGIRPPNVKSDWDDCGVYTQALIVAFHQTCEHDEDERMAQMMGAQLSI